MFSVMSATLAISRRTKRVSRLRALIALAAVLTAFASPACSQQTASPSPAATDTFEKRVFHSNALQRDMPYQVVLPVGYVAGEQRYPVLYLLHGWQGDETNWIKHTHLTELAASYQLIIVTPRAENSWYVNSATKPAD